VLGDAFSELEIALEKSIERYRVRKSDIVAELRGRYAPVRWIVRTLQIAALQADGEGFTLDKKSKTGSLIDALELLRDEVPGVVWPKKHPVTTYGCDLTRARQWVSQHVLVFGRSKNIRIGYPHPQNLRTTTGVMTRARTRSMWWPM
jgi:hypothetical protein